MSAPEFPEPEDTQVLLAEALRLIDTCDAGTIFSDADLDLDLDVDPESLRVPELRVDAGTSASPATGEEPQANARKRRKRVRDPSCDARRRAKAKEERELLRVQARGYEAQLGRLKQQRRLQDGSNGVVDGNDSGAAKCGTSLRWLDTALESAEKRRKAEELNRQLRELLVERAQRNAAITALLANETEYLTRAQRVVERWHPPSPRSLTAVVGPDLSRARMSVQLKQRLPELFSAIDDVFGRTTMGSLGEITRSQRAIRQDTGLGPGLELTSSTPLACALEDATTILWGAVLEKQWPPPQTAFSLKEKELTAQSVELGYTIGFDGPSERVQVNGVSLLQKCEQDYRNMMVWTSQIADPRGGLSFRSQGWVMLMRSPTNPLRACVLRTCCRVQAEHLDARTEGVENGVGGGVHQSADPTLRNTMLRGMSKRMAARVDDFRRTLLERTGAADEDALLLD